MYEGSEEGDFTRGTLRRMARRPVTPLLPPCSNSSSMRSLHGFDIGNFLCHFSLPFFLSLDYQGLLMHRFSITICCISTEQPFDRHQGPSPTQQQRISVRRHTISIRRSLSQTAMSSHCIDGNNTTGILYSYS